MFLELQMGRSLVFSLAVFIQEEANWRILQFVDFVN